MPQRRKRAFKHRNVVKRTSYSIEMKREVVNFAKQHGRRVAADHFNLNISMVGRWEKASTNWTTVTNGKKKKIGSGRKTLYPEAEKVLYSWIIKQRKQGLAVTYTIIQIKMKEILSEPNMIALYDSISDFKVSLSWLRKFLKRHGLVLRRRTKISQKLPKQTKELLENFNGFVTHLRIENSFEMCNIFNMDETPVWFDMAGNFTVNQKGEKTVHIRSTGNEKNRFTVVLTCTADGNKLPPICIFKGKKLSRAEKEKIPSGVIVWFQKNGWMDVNLMKKYIDYFNDNRSGDPAMLVYDSFKGHLEASIKKNFRENDVYLAVIPGGLTSICQPLDVAINKPFKDNLRQEWHLWMASGGAGETINGNLRRAKISDVCSWVKRSWEKISDEIIIESFKKCGITDSLVNSNEEEELDINEESETGRSEVDEESETEAEIEEESETEAEIEEESETEAEIEEESEVKGESEIDIVSEIEKLVIDDTDYE